jgi:hypothetical protein
LITIQSDIDKFLQGQTATIKQLMDVNKILRSAALDTVAIISHRVQQEGKNATGELMKTKSKTSFGAYSKAYGKKRTSKGLQTNIVDLTNSGDTQGDFIFAQEENGYAVGFRGQKASQIAEYNEAYYGKTYDLSEDELKGIVQTIDKNVSEVIR